jgi:hypothetical protein
VPRRRAADPAFNGRPWVGGGHAHASRDPWRPPGERRPVRELAGERLLSDDFTRAGIAEAAGGDEGRDGVVLSCECAEVGIDTLNDGRRDDHLHAEASSRGASQ